MSKRNKSKLKKQKQENLFEVYFLIISLIILLPLIHSSKTLDYNTAPRLLTMGIVIMVFSLWSIFKRNNNFQFIKLIIFPVSILYLTWSLITLIPATNPGEGSFDITKTILTIGLLVYAVQAFTSNKVTINVLVKSVIISAVIAASYGIFQYLTEVSGTSDGDLYMALYAVKGLMAHKNQFAISLMLMLPFVIYGIFILDKWWKGAAIYALLLIFIDIVIIQTRSVWIATLFFIISFLLLGIIFLLKNNLKSFLTEKKRVIIISFSVLIIIVTTTFFILQKSGTSSLAKYQITSTFNTKSNNAQWRIKMWNSSLQLAKDNLILGVGAGNWKNDIIPYYHLNFGGKYQNWRRPHNDFLWVLTEKGVFGLLIFLSIFSLIFFYGFKILFNEKDKNKLLLTALMISGIGSYIIASLFTFPLERINHQVYLVFMIAIIISLYYNPNDKESPFRLATKINLIILVFSLFSVYYSYLYLRQELSITKLAESLNRGNQRQAIKYVDIAYTPFTTIDNNNIPVKMFRGVANMQLQQYKQAYNDFQSARKSFPNQVAVLNNLAIVSAELNKNKEAISYLDQALYLFPHFEESLGNKVIIYYRAKKYKKAYEALLNQDTRHPGKQYLQFKSGLEKLINK